MLSKKVLKKRVGNIPLFELKDVSIYGGDEWIYQEDFKGVTEVGEDEALAIHSDKYNLYQIRDIFEEGLEAIEEDVEGEVYYRKGRGELEIYPTERNKDVGLLVRNSVDGSSALKVDFSAKLRGKTIPIPETKVKGYSRIHSCQDAGIEVKRYFDMLSDVEDAWDTIVDTLGEEEIGKEELQDIAEDLGLGKDFNDYVEKYVDSDPFEPIKYWNLIVKAIKHIDRDDYKSELHYREKVRDVSEEVISRAVAEEL